MSLNLRKKKLKPPASNTIKRRKTSAKPKSNPFTLAKRKADNTKTGVVEKLSALRVVTQIEDEEYLLALLKHANYNVEAGIKHHFEDEFLETYKRKQVDCHAKADSKAEGFPKLLRKYTVFVESTMTLNPEETDELFNSESAEPYSVSAEGGSIVRVHRKSLGELVTFGRLPRELGRALGSLLEAGFVSARADLEMAPTRLEILTRIPVQLSVWLENKEVFAFFEKGEKKKDNELALGFFSLVNQLFRDQLSLKRQRIPCIADSCCLHEKPKGVAEIAPPSPEGLTCKLYEHQQFALRWMLRRENAGRGVSPESSLWRQVNCDSEAELNLFINSEMQQCSLVKPMNRAVCRGGILADEMGMGKTVCVISLILASRPKSSSGSSVFSSSSASREVTLIVCPSSLLGQWRREVVGKVKASHKLSHLVYHGSASKCNSLDEYEVVITSYGQVSSEVGSSSSRLFRMKWSRVILDEGHLIKNSKTNLSRACAKLAATSKWILTGTPIQNSLEDLYSFFKFFHLEPWCSAHYWSEAIAKPFEAGASKEILAKLHRLLNQKDCPLMLRRKKSSAGLLEASKKVVEVVKIALAKGEREFYENVLQRSRTEFQGYFETGQAKDKYAAIFTLLLRLRQTCNHPFLVLKGRDEEADKENTNSNVPTQVGLKETMEAQTSEYGRRILSEWTQEDGAAERECPICLEDAQEPVMTGCAHVACKSCLDSFVDKFADSGCPVCRSPIDISRVVHLDRLSREQRLNAYKAKSNLKRSSKMNWLFRSLEEIHQINTQKLTKEVVVQKYLGSADDDVAEKPIKVVIFSQWTSFLSMLEDHLAGAGKGAVRLDGSMSSQAREAAIEKFHSDKSTWIFLISLRAGSLGLNLTVASVMYIMDPWFNPTVEEQAIDRCHRLGQTRPVHVYRPVVENSVEERMLELQVQKASMAKSVLDETQEEEIDLGKKKVLSFEELASFFK